MKRSIVLMVLMCCAALGAFAIKPTKLLADQLPPIHLEAMVPKAFGEWRAVEQGALQVINPQAETLVNTLYQEVLNRVYVNQSGYAVMLSIAYGKDQSDTLQMHKPEICYPAQGFQILDRKRVSLDVQDRNIGVTQLVTRLGQRNEPVTYWSVIGNQVTYGGYRKKISEMRYGFEERTKPDGMLVRVSSIDYDLMRAFKMHKQFSSSMIGAISKNLQPRFVGLEQTISSAP